MHGGVDAVADVTEQNTLTFGGTWAAGDTFLIRFTDTRSAAQYRFGFGDPESNPISGVTGLLPSYALTLNDKVYIACGTRLVFSAIGNPDALVDIVTVGATDGDDPGNGQITPGNNYGTPENIQALANYQGKLAIINRNSTQIWVVDADPANNNKGQTLENIGTFAPKSVQSVGTLDVMLLADSGFRSLRVRDSSGNAEPVDIGTPIETLVQALLATLTESEKAGACGIVDPASGRYWCFVPASGSGEGTIYVLSYFPSSQIAAWSTYRPTYNNAGTQTAFKPLKFITKDGKVYVRTADGLIAVSGYDACGVTCELPWLSVRNPLLKKSIQSIAVGCQGSWVVSLATDTATGTYKTVYTRSDATNASSWQLGRISVQANCPHFRVKMVENGSGYARFSNQAVNYEGGTV